MAAITALVSAWYTAAISAVFTKSAEKGHFLGYGRAGMPGGQPVTTVAARQAAAA